MARATITSAKLNYGPQIKPQQLERASIEILLDASENYHLCRQIESGAEILQIFERIGPDCINGPVIRKNGSSNRRANW